MAACPTPRKGIRCAEELPRPRGRWLPCRSCWRGALSCRAAPSSMPYSHCSGFPFGRPPVSLDLRHVVQAAHAEAVVLAVQRVCDGAPDGGLPHARGAHLRGVTKASMSYAVADGTRSVRQRHGAHVEMAGRRLLRSTQGPANAKVCPAARFRPCAWCHGLCPVAASQVSYISSLAQDVSVGMRFVPQLPAPTPRTYQAQDFALRAAA